MNAISSLRDLGKSLHLGLGLRLEMVLQSEAAECGLACIAMVMGFLGHPVDLPDLRRRHGMSLRGATLKDLTKVASALGLMSRPLRLELDELQHLKIPCILHWDLNHFVVLREVDPRSVVIHDPAVGVRRLSLEETSKHFTGIALELSPTAAIESVKTTPRVRMRTLLGSMVGLKAALGRIFTTAVAIEILTALSPFFMQWVVDDALVTGDRDLLTTLALAFGLLLVFRVALSSMRSWMLLSASVSMSVQGRSNLFAHLVELPSSYFEARQLGDVLSRFGSQETILTAVTTDAVEAVLDGLLTVLTLVLMFVFAPGLSLIVLAGTALYALLRWLSYTPLRHASIEAIAWGARRDTHFLETLRGMKTIKLFNAQDERRRSWMNLLVEAFNRTLTTQKLTVIFTTANMLLSGLITIVVVWLGARSVLERTFTAGALLAFLAYKEQFMTRVMTLINRALDLHMLKIHGERLADIALTAPEERDHAGRAIAPRSTVIAPDRAPAAIEVRNLRFRYSEQDPWVLDGVDFKIEPGESVAIVGSSGCGKTTLLKMLSSLLQPSEGEVVVDGQSIKQIGLGEYREMLGVVMQDDQLFAGSIAENIAFFSDYVDYERVEECARKAAVHDAIVAMPMGYATLIGDMGAALSGGQKQRILIARSLYRNPSILLLDEATSHLDVTRERAVNEAIQRSHLTRIIVAHRPETILSADRVIVLANGRVLDERRRGDGKLALVSAPTEPLVLEAKTEIDPPQEGPMERLLDAWRRRAQRVRMHTQLGETIDALKRSDDETATATARMREFVMPPQALREDTKGSTRKRGRYARATIDQAKD